MRTATRSGPQDLSLRSVQLEPVGTHPPGDIINAVGDDVLKLQRRRRSARPVDLSLCVVCVQMWAKTVTLDQRSEVGGVQQK